MFYQDEHSCNSELVWHGLYRQSHDLITEESRCHPAKMSVALAFRIIEHLKEMGLLSDGQTILDPMCGISTTGVVAGALGHPFIGVELESKFVALSMGNKEYAEKRLHKKLTWTILQGDSRHLSELLHGNGLKAVLSSPYLTSEGQSRTRTNRQVVAHSWAVTDEQRRNDGYGTTEGQIGNLPDKPLKAILSPPYEDSLCGDDRPPEKQKIFRDQEVKRNRTFRGSADWVRNTLGTTEGQIGQEKAESYLSAMQTIYAELAKVSDVLVVVTKNPTRSGKLRRLDEDTISILEASGWKLHCRHQALLFEELEQSTLFGEVKKQAKGRLSFFKRLSWQKGQPVAGYEDILVCQRVERETARMI